MDIWSAPVCDELRVAWLPLSAVFAGPGRPAQSRVNAGYPRADRASGGDSVGLFFRKTGLFESASWIHR
jgi:hypothetical protein